MLRIRQMDGMVWLGRLKITFVRTSAYFSYINFFMLLMTFYSVIGYKYAPLPMFLLAAAVGVLVIGMIDYFIMLPSDMCFSNQQIAKHQNPIYDEVKAIHSKICDNEERH